MKKRIFLFIVVSLLFVGSLFSTFVVSYNLLHQPFTSFDNESRIMNNPALIRRQQEDSMRLNYEIEKNKLKLDEVRIKTNLYYEIINDENQQIVAFNPNYKGPLEHHHIIGLSRFNQNKGMEGPLTGPLKDSGLPAGYTINYGWDSQSSAYLNIVEIYDYFESMCALRWGTLGWILVAVAWIAFMVVHYRDSKTSIFTKIPTELILFIGIAGWLQLSRLLTYGDFINIVNYASSLNALFLAMGGLGLFLYILAVFFSSLIMILLAKLKTKTLFKESFLGKITSGLISVFVNKDEKSQSLLFLALVGLVILHGLIFVLGTYNTLTLTLLFGFDIYLLYKLFDINKQRIAINQHLNLVRQGAIDVPLSSADFNPIFTQSINDINNLQEGLETALERAIKEERMNIDLITNVSHDLKTPITTILNYTDFLINDVNPEQHQQYLQTIKEKAIRLNELAGSVVEASKASSGKLEVEMTILNVLELLNQVLVDFQSSFMEKQLVLLVDEPSIDYLALADSQKLYRVFENLFKNLERYTMEGSRIYIEGNQDGNQLTIEFKNISKYQLGDEDLTARFVIGDNARQQEGSGLGLAISKDLMRLMEGNLEVKVDGDLFKVILSLKRPTI